MRKNHIVKEFLRTPSTSGFTLVELLVATSLAAIILAVAGPSTFGILSSFQRNSDRAAILADFQNISFWLSHDVRMAESTSLTDNGPPSSTLSLSWVDKYDGANATHYAIYNLFNNEVSRNHDGFYKTIAWHVASTSFSMIDGRIEATTYSIPYYGNPGGQRRDYAFTPRP